MTSRHVNVNDGFVENPRKVTTFQNWRLLLAIRDIRYDDDIMYL